MIYSRLFIMLFCFFAFTETAYSSSSYCEENDCEKLANETVVEGIFDKALSFIGLSEKKNPQKIKNITEVDPRKTPWCAAFINGILRREGLETTGSNKAISFAEYGEEVKEPNKGDIVVFKNHVGFFVEFVEINNVKYVAVLGGNQKNKVRISNFPLKTVVSFRRIMA